MGNPVPPRPSSGVEVEARSFIRRLYDSPTTRTAVVVGVIGLFVTVSIGGVLGPLLVVGALAVIVVTLSPSLTAAFGWEAAKVELPTTALTLGSSPTVTYRRRARRPPPAAEFGIQCKVVCQERVEYRRGTDTEVDTATVFEQSYTGRGTSTGDGLEGTVKILIPVAAGAPTFDLGDNAVRWWLETTVDGAGLPSDRQRFPITVSAALDPDVRNQIGDR